MTAKVALVYPPLWDSVDSPPLGPAVLAGALRAAGIEAGFVDLNLDFHEWLFSNEALAWLLSRAREGDHREEVAGIEHLLGLPAAQRVARPERTAPLMALSYALGMRARPVLGPQRFLVGVDSSKVRLGDLLAPRGEPEPRMEFWRAWIAAHVRPIVERGPALVAMTISYVGQLLPAILIAQELGRCMTPAPKVIVGGPWCTHQAVSGVDVTPLFSVFDGIGVGPGDQVIVRAAASAPELPRDIPGLWCRGQRRPERGPERGPELDRPAPTSPDFSAMPLDRYFAAGPPRYPLESSRGCWAACRYCNYPALNRGYRVKGIEQIVAEVTAIHDRHPGAEITFVDDTILPKRALVMAEALGGLASARGHAVRWSGCLRPDAGLTAEQCRALAAGGMWRVFIGLDAATQDLLDGIDKRVTVAEIRELVGNYKAAGIIVAGNFILGLPGETLAAREAVPALMDELGLDREHVTTSLFALVRGSWYYDHIEELGWPEEWVRQVRSNDVLTDFLPAYSLRVLQ
ncbi:MAG TPA: radical SAM protein [Kofleriaceae bacterium]|nr:radical SAM protein [Kofleriaceae bacterium]